MLVTRLRIAALALGVLALTAVAYQKELATFVGARSSDGHVLTGFMRLDAQSVRATQSGKKSHTPISQALLLVPGVQGPIRFNGNHGYIGIGGYSIGAATATRPGEPVLDALQISKPVDATSPVFSDHYFSNTPFTGVTTLDFVVQNAAVQEIQLTNARVVSDTIQGSSAAPSETLTLTYAGIKFCIVAKNAAVTCTDYNFATPSPSPPPATPTPTASPTPHVTPTPTASPTPHATPTPVPTSTPTLEPISIVEYSSGLSPGANPQLIRLGHDGKMWFAENGTSKIATISSAGTITEYPVTTANSGPVEIVEAPNGFGGTTYNAFTESAADKIGVMNTSGTMIKEYSVPMSSAPFGLTTDSSGADLWFTQNGSGAIGKMTSDGTITEFTTSAQPLSIVENVADLKLYFTEPGGYIGVVNNPTTTPTLGQYSSGLNMGASPWGITRGSDGQMWFTDQGTDAIGAMNTTTHAIAEYSTGLTLGDTYPRDIASGPDGALWFTEWGANKIGRIDPTTHAITEYPVATANSKPYGIVQGPSGSLYMWFTECGGNKIGRIGPIPTSGGAHLRHGLNGTHASAKVHLARP